MALPSYEYLSTHDIGVRFQACIRNKSLQPTAIVLARHRGAVLLVKTRAAAAFRLPTFTIRAEDLNADDTARMRLLALVGEKTVRNTSFSLAPLCCSSRFDAAPAKNDGYPAGRIYRVVQAQVEKRLSPSSIAAGNSHTECLWTPEVRASELLAQNYHDFSAPLTAHALAVISALRPPTLPTTAPVGAET